jgi:hypothetical protein
MSKTIGNIIAIATMLLLAFASLPIGRDNDDESKDSEPKKATSLGHAGSASNPGSIAEGSVKSSDSPLQFDEETKAKFNELLTEHLRKVTQWKMLQAKKVEDEKKLSLALQELKQESSAEPDRAEFEEREWSTDDQKFKTIASLITTDFKTASLKKKDGTIIEISKEKLSSADKQYIERAFAAIEVATRRNKSRVERIASLKDQISLLDKQVSAASVPSPKEPSIDDAKILIAKEREDRALAAIKQSKIDGNNLVKNSEIEIRETKIIDWITPAGVPMDMIVCEFRNLSMESIRAIDVDYFAYDAADKLVLKQGYTLFAAEGKDNGLKPNASHSTKDEGLVIPKTLGAKTARVSVTKVETFERLDATGVGSSGVSPNYAPEGFNFISSREDPKTPGDWMHIYSTPNRLTDRQQVIDFCKAFRDKSAGKHGSFLVVFDDPKNAVYPHYPYTALYTDLEVFGHIRFYYVYNRESGFSQLTFVNQSAPGGGQASFTVP